MDDQMRQYLAEVELQLRAGLISSTEAMAKMCDLVFNPELDITKLSPGELAWREVDEKMSPHVLTLLQQLQSL